MKSSILASLTIALLATSCNPASNPINRTKGSSASGGKSDGSDGSKGDEKSGKVTLPIARGGKSSQAMREMSQQVKSISASLAPAKSEAETLNAPKWQALGLNDPKDPVAEAVSRSISLLEGAAASLATRADELESHERSFMVTNDQGQTELQGMKELRAQLDSQIAELTGSHTDSIGQQNQETRKVELLRAELAKKSQEASAAKASLTQKRAEVDTPVKEISKIVSEKGPLFDFDPKKELVDYAKADMLLEILQDLDGRVNQMGTATANLELDLTAFDGLASDMESLSAESASIASQVALVQSAIRARKESAEVSNKDSVESSKKLKQLQVDLKITVDAFRQNLTAYSDILKSIKQNDVVAITTEVNRLKGAADILKQLADQEPEPDLKTRYLSVRSTITSAMGGLEAVEANLNSKVTEANGIVSGQEAILADQDTLQIRQTQLLEQLDGMIQDQAKKIESHNEIVKKIDDLLTEIQTISAVHGAAVSDIMKLKGDLGAFQIEFTQAMAQARILLQKARLNVVTANLTRSWRNPFLDEDVNFDGVVTPIDALILINALNAKSYPTVLRPNGRPFDAPFIDVSGDNNFSSIDAIFVVNYINRMRR